MEQSKAKTTFQEPKEPPSLEISPMQQINIPSSSSANYTEYAELKHALVRCFNCSSEIADAYARRLAQCSVPEGHDREEWLLYLAWEIGITELGVAGLTESIPSVVTTEPTMFRLSQSP